MKTILLNAKENTDHAINQLFNALFENRIINYLLYPRKLGNNTAFQCLSKRKDDFSDNAIFVPVMAVNSAKVISEFSFKKFQDKVGVVIRPCEAKAVIELIKLKQIDAEDLVIITFDCLGIVAPADFQNQIEEYKDIDKLKRANINKYARGQTVFADELPKSCRACITPTYQDDIHIGLIGTDGSVSISLKDQIFEELKDKFDGVVQDSAVEKREQLLSEIVKERTLCRDKIIAEFRDQIKSVDDLLAVFSTCMKCSNCREACPICYCRECIFETKLFEHSPSTFKKWLEKKDAVKLPADTLLFHLTRLNHMSFACVACGYCSRACPNKLPVFELFLVLGSDVQKIFDYEPGRSIDDPLPLTEFKEEELESVES